MKRIIRFSRFFLPAVIFSLILAAAGITGYALKGFNLGVDFQAGFIQEVQFAPAALSLTWSGQGNAIFSFDRTNVYIVIAGAGVEGRTHAFPFSRYGTLGALADALGSQVEGIAVSLTAGRDVSSLWLMQSAQGNPQLGSDPYVVHYIDPAAGAVNIRDVRDALTSLGETVSVQNLGNPEDRHFMIRLRFEEEGSAGIPAGRIVDSLEAYFGRGSVAVLRSDLVDQRFSRNLTDQAGRLLGLTLLIILIYASIRFKPQYAIGAVLALIHDALIMVAFISWSRMEFNTTTIAAILTILGYSINNTIVIFDRIRESRHIYPNSGFVDILDRSLSETLGRTIITTFTTMLAVLALYIFTTGSIKDFALALLVGLVSGAYSSMFIAPGFVNFWDRQSEKRKKKPAAVPARA
ncbi:MAG: protein translocase subunit SecF [Treponema sp.]|jgi:preprotein translocase subunit SecF|nr:protein translocase subunit SecF [Treponema sp.]